MVFVIALTRFPSHLWDVEIHITLQAVYCSDSQESIVNAIGRCVRAQYIAGGFPLYLRQFSLLHLANRGLLVLNHLARTWFPLWLKISLTNKWQMTMTSEALGFNVVEELASIIVT